MDSLQHLSISINSKLPAQLEKAKKLSLALNIALNDDVNQISEFHLVYTDSHLELRTISEDMPKKTWKMSIDFIGGSSGFRRKFSSTTKQPIARAIGIKPGYRPTVIDATAGLGGDAFVFASLGCRVTLFERSQILTALLQDALQRAQQHPETREIVKNMELVSGDSLGLLDAHNSVADTIYLDPMYPHKKKSSLNKKEMRVIRKLVGDDLDAELLFTKAMIRAKKRVVVKRPKGAPTLTADKPSHIITMKHSRFDIYISPHL